jgi:Plasmid pRiA4b ORF-3-like protein
VADRGLEHRSAASAKLQDVAPGAGDRFTTPNDFGDDWERDLLVKDVFAAEPGVAYPRCLTGRRACRPGTAAGAGVIRNCWRSSPTPAIPSDGNRLEWLGLSSVQEFDPTAVDLANINHNLSKLAIVVAKK